MRVVLATVAALVLAVVAATASHADTAPLADSPDLPWTNPTHESGLELLLSRIATEIARRDVTIRCEGDTDWRKLVAERGGDPDAELGYVGVDYTPRGRLRSVADFAELTGESVCLPLKRFAVAATKPTKCVVVSYRRSTVYVQQRVNGVTRRVPKVVFTKAKAPAACYLGNLHSAKQMSDAYWQAYSVYANAMLTLAHESIHLRAAPGDSYDPLGEAKASCLGMQLIPLVAQELGATADDAQAIATFYWDAIYPDYRTGAYSRYWSAECRSGGAMDVRDAGKTAWP